ncbi:unnamed protein product, partial [Scytosiphon promiscuus]
LNSVAALQGKSVAQRYLTNPLLIDGYKFDLRLYVLVTSVDPMRIFLFDDGLVRICTEVYEAPAEHNIDKTTMHLTNYSVNKASSNFTSDDSGESGFKRSIKWFKKWLEEQGHDSGALWARLADACVKTLLTVGPMLRREYFMANPIPGYASAATKSRTAASVATSGATQPPLPSRSTCFTIVGMDLMVDDKLEPWIIEINHLPSFRTETGMDLRIKKQLVFNTLSLLDVRVGAREEWQEEMERLKRTRFFGLPSKAAGGASPRTAPKGRLAAGTIYQQFFFLHKGATSRLAAGRARENFEQAVKGGFERVFPPSETAPNTSISYAKVLRVAEKVFASLSSYHSPAHSPRSTSPSPTSPRGNRGDSAASPTVTSPKSPRVSLTQPSQPSSSPRNSLSSQPSVLQPCSVEKVTAARKFSDSSSAPARPMPSVVGESGDGDDQSTPGSTSSERSAPRAAETRRVEFALEGDSCDNGRANYEVGLSGEAEAPPGTMKSSSPPHLRRRRKNGKGKRNQKNRSWTNGSPSRSPARRKGRGGGAARRDWEKEAKRRRNLHKKAIAKAEAEAIAMETAENNGQLDRNRCGQRWDEETWHGEGEGMAHDTPRGVPHEDGRESMVDLEGPRQQQQQHSQQERRRQRPRWGEVESLQFHKSHAPSVVLSRRPTSGGPACRGMGSIVQNNANDAMTTGWHRGGGAKGALPNGCSLRVFPGGAPGGSPGVTEREYHGLHHGQLYSSPAPLPSSSGGCWPTRMPFRPSIPGSRHSSVASKLPPFRFSRAKLGESTTGCGDCAGAVRGIGRDVCSYGFDSSGGRNGSARSGTAGRPGSAALHDTHAVRRAVEVPTAGKQAVVMTGTTPQGRPAQYLPSIQDGSRREYDVDVGNGTGSNIGRKGRRRGHQRPQTTGGSRRTAYQCIVDLLPPVSAARAKTASVKGSLNFHFPTSSLVTAKTRPTSSPRKLTSGGSDKRRTTRTSGSGPTELIMPTVSLCLGVEEDDVGPPADSSRDGRHSFGESGSSGTRRTSHRVSPASLLVQATSAVSPAGRVRQDLPDRSNAAHRACSGSRGGSDGRVGHGGGVECIRPAEATAVDGGDKSATRLHGFRRWRPGESEAGGGTRS